MGWLRRIRQAVTRAEPFDVMSLRRWEAGKTTRINAGHWQQATGQTINLDLMGRLDTLRVRSEYEASANTTVQGVIHSYLVYLIGKQGPLLQVTSDDNDWNETLEQLWAEWWKAPEIKGLSGHRLLKTWVRSLWIAGEFLCQIVTDPDAKGPIKTRLNNIHPRRLLTPMSEAANPRWMMGVERDALGRVQRYAVAANDDYQVGPAAAGEPIPARDMIHWFVLLEEGQVRGVPWLAGGLDDVGELRDFEAQVLDAARAAADMGIYFWTNNAQADFRPVNTSAVADFHRRTQSFLPPGYQPMQVNPQQPAPHYVQYIAERKRGIGRPVSMPLMMVQLDSSGHNYSSARFDGQSFKLGLEDLQGDLGRDVLTRLVELIKLEAQRAGALKATPKGRITFDWIWPQLPHVDPLKEEKAAETRRNNSFTTLTDELRERRRDLQVHIAMLKREKEAFEAAGLEYPGPKQATAAAEPDKDDEDDTPPPKAGSNGRLMHA